MNRQMLKTVAAAGLVCLCLAGGAWAYQSSYSSISVPGKLTDAGDWNPSVNLLTLTADKTWSGTLQVTAPGEEFKFAANNSWDVMDWGGVSPAVRLPARGLGPLAQRGSNLKLPDGTAEGAYVFTFHEDTATYDVVPANPVAPAVTSARLVGSFNGEGADAGGDFAGSGDVWTAADVAMSKGSTFRVLVNGTETWGRSGGSGSVTMAQLAAGVTPCGEDAFSLDVERGGKFTFTMDFRNNLLTAVQTETNSTEVASVRIYGNFVKGGTALPGPNLEEADGVWSGTFLVTNRTFLMGFAGLNAGGEIVKRWGGVSALSGSTNVTLKSYDDTDITKNRVNVTAGAGAYTLRFNPTSGSLALTWSGMVNLFKNPGFESGNEAWADDWGLYRAEATSDFDVHSGNRAAMLYRRYDEEPNLGNVDQSIYLESSAGRTLRVTGNFRAVDGWSGDKVRIIVEWMAGGEVVSSAEKEVLNLGNAWQEETLETTVPQNDVTAHVLFKYDGGVLGEALLVDDVQAYLAGGRSENFDTWGAHDSFAKMDYGWEASRAKTVLNDDLMPKVDGDLLISKYIEGANNDKAIELYNGTTNAVDLSKYQLREYDNGSKSATRTVKLSGVLQPKECAIITREDSGPLPPDPALQAGLTIRTNALRFNGDDVVVLSKGALSFVDRVGQVDTNASRTFWAKTMRDHTLVRKAAVTNGTSGAVTKAFDLTQWDVLEKGDFGNVGHHSFTEDDGAYWPGGYALCMDANSTLTLGGISAGGVGDVDFWYRAWDGAATLVAEMAADETSASWTEIWRADVAATATTYAHAQFTVSGAGQGAFRLRTIGGAALVDEINVGEAMSIKRIEHFSDWDVCTPSGLYMRNQWKVQGVVNTNGEAASMAAVLSAEGDYVQSPFFTNGVGTVVFKAGSVASGKAGTLSLATSTDGGLTWETNKTWSVSTTTRGTNLTYNLSFTSQSAVRLSWTGGGALYVDDVNVKVPQGGSRTLTFDTLTPTTAYGDYSVGGWTVTKTAVTNNGAVGNGGILYGTKGSVILSPRLDELTDISFQFKYWPNKTTVRFTVDVSADGSKWTTLTTTAGAGGSETAWTLYTTNVPADKYHYVRIKPTQSSMQVLIDEIGLKEPSAQPSVQLSAWLDPWPVANEPFQIAATAYPKDGAVLQTVRAVYSIGGKWSTNTLSVAGGGEYRSGTLTVANNQVVKYRVECVYTGTGIGTQTNRTALEEVTVSSSRPGDVWINEVVYEALKSESDDSWDDDDWWSMRGAKRLEPRSWWDTCQDHEFVELCGKAGTSIGGWTVELGFVKAADIAQNGGEAIYATYTIPSGTTLSDAGNGFGFYVIGDQELKDAGEAVDLALTTLVPPAMMSEATRDHINDSAGVIRLKKDQLVIQSLSYGAYEGESEYIPASQDEDTEVGIALSGEGGSPDAFAWGIPAELTIGSANPGQTLVPPAEKDPLPVWYDAAHVAEGTRVGTFAMFEPLKAANVDAVVVHYGYDTADFANANYLTGTLYHRLKGATAWTAVTRNNESVWNNVTDADGHGYVAFEAIPARTYGRLQTMEYFIEAGTTSTNYATVWLGTDSTGATIAFDSRESAEKSPFEHTFTISQRIAVTAFARDEENGTLALDTTGNDEFDRFENFKVEWTPTMTDGKTDWQPLEIKTHTGAYQDDHFVVVAPQPTNRMQFIRVQPLP